MRMGTPPRLYLLLSLLLLLPLRSIGHPTKSNILLQNDRNHQRVQAHRLLRRGRAASSINIPPDADGDFSPVPVKGKWPSETRQRRQFGPHFSSKATPSTLPLGGGFSLGEYYIAVRVGGVVSAGAVPAPDADDSPCERVFNVQVDTGSSDLALVSTLCSKTRGCHNHSVPWWDPAGKGNCRGPGVPAIEVGCHPPGGVTCGSCVNGQCAYALEYEDGSGFKALAFNDSVAFGEGARTGARAFAGAITAVSNGGQPFEPFHLDGIMGFAGRAASQINAPTPFALSVTAGIYAPVFSMCGNLAGGVITLGGVGAGVSSSRDISWTPMIDYLASGFYNIDGRDLLVNGVSVGVPPSRYTANSCTVDSGTSAFYVPTKAFWGVYRLLVQNCSIAPLRGVCGGVARNASLFSGFCFKLTPADVAAWPTLTFVAGKGADEVRIPFPPESYLLPGCSGDAALFALWLGDIGEAGGTLLGDPLMLSSQVVYDIGNQRIGFAPKGGCRL
jgi:Eukaryotic aspartyl protease